MIQERLTTLILEGQRHEVWVRSEPDEEGVWHNALLFERDGKLSPTGALRVGLDWHLPPGIARERAGGLSEGELLELYRRSLRPRPPIV